MPSVLEDSIISEQAGTAYAFEGDDKNILEQMCNEINQTYSYNSYKYYCLSQIDLMTSPPGISNILLKYIYQFKSELCRAALVRRIMADTQTNKVKIKDLDRIVMDLYHHFRASPYYISPPESGISSHLYIRYDNAFKYLKSPKIVPELVELMKFRREIYILSITAFSIAKKWAPKELGEIMATHLMNRNVTRADVGLPKEGNYYPSLETIVEQTSFNAIKCLQFYPSEENLKIIMDYTNHSNKDLAKFAYEHAEKMKKKLLEM